MKLKLKSKPRLNFKSKNEEGTIKPFGEKVTFNAVVNHQGGQTLIPITGCLVHSKRIKNVRFVIHRYFHLNKDRSVVFDTRWAVSELTSGHSIWYPGIVAHALQSLMHPLSREDVVNIAEDRCLEFGEEVFWREMRNAAQEKALLELGTPEKPKLHFKPRFKAKRKFGLNLKRR